MHPTRHKNVEEKMQSEPEKAHRSETIEVPAPTPWPFVTAFGLALVFAGFVTILAVTVTGLVVVLFGAVGWIRNVLPVAKVEEVPSLGIEPAISRVRPSTRTVSQLIPGPEGHRVYIPVKVHPYSTGLVGGAVG